MKRKSIKTLINPFIIAATAMIFLIFPISRSCGAQQTRPVKNIVIVHDAFADGSGTEDKSINADISMKMYKRCGSVISRIKGSHVVFISHPEEGSAVIISAKKAASK